MEKEIIYNNRKLNNTKTWLLFLFFGWSYGSMGNIGKQILFYITLGGFGLWTLYVMFTLNKKIKCYNRLTAVKIGYKTKDLIKEGLI